MPAATPHEVATRALDINIINSYTLTHKTPLNHPSPPRDVHKRHPDTRQAQDKHTGLKHRIADLAAIPAAQAGAEVVRRVGVREGRVGHLLAQELAQGLPAAVHVVLEQAVRGHELAHEVVVLGEDLLALVLEVALEQAVPEQEEHGPVEGEGPVEVRDEVRGGV